MPGPTKINADIAAERESHVLLLRTREGMTFRQIADEVGCDVKNAYAAWKRAMGKWAEEASQARAEEVGKQLAVLDALLDAFLPLAVHGDARAAEVVLKALDHHARVLGLYAAVKVEATVTDEMTARIMQLADEIAAL